MRTGLMWVKWFSVFFVLIFCILLNNCSCSQLQNLRPQLLWRHFYEISLIPRPSKHEERVLEYIKNIGLKESFSISSDKKGNLLIKCPGINGGEDAKPILIQTHVDMVTEKNEDTIHDFLRDPIVLISDGDWVRAKGTTLGADNGIGVATALALLNPSSVKSPIPPLECLFTVEEEIGLQGAKVLDTVTLGITAKTMLNLDTEELGVAYVGCAGGGDTLLTVHCSRSVHSSPPSAAITTLVKVSLSGLLGGHSGINIHEGRGNAVQLLAAVVQNLLQQTHLLERVKLVDMRGGNKRNAIAREAFALLSLRCSDGEEASLLAAVEEYLDVQRTNLIAQYGELEKSLQLALHREVDELEQREWRNLDGTFSPIDDASTRRLLSLLRLLPHGPLKFSYSVKDLEVGSLATV